MRLILNLKIEENGAEIHGLLVKFKEEHDEIVLESEALARAVQKE